jgi:hypothetical protein
MCAGGGLKTQWAQEHMNTTHENLEKIIILLILQHTDSRIYR